MTWIPNLLIKKLIFQGEGFNCRTNRTNGDGSWSRYSVAKLGVPHSLFLKVSNIMHNA